MVKVLELYSIIKGSVEDALAYSVGSSPSGVTVTDFETATVKS